MKQTDVLKMIAEEFNDRKLTWAVGASMMLYLRGITVDPMDIDITVAPGDFDMAGSILSSLGTRQEAKDKSSYSTRFFNEYSVAGVGIDLMAGMRINNSGKIYEYDFDKDTPVDPYVLDGTTVFLNPAEDWYLLYSLMPGRFRKVQILGEYISHTGIRHPSKLREAAGLDIPDEVKERIGSLLENSLSADVL